ncbi:hypothetical protein [Xanthobacter aminoxidans]|uniref:hypothetical protein n=1 Tax=Xanthobacter aminoxidans TaxID=186280 RepID=UPI00202315A6|nr:hypothetical protein [Xanthobacter aminoxidans]MCL8382085.1 hypothetical protein [Xanthobacter aminoxidans]
MGPARRFDHEKVLTLFSQKLETSDIARRMGMSTAAVCNVLRAACDAGDPRAARYQKRTKLLQGPQPQPLKPVYVPRPNVMTIHVVTMGRNDGLARKLPVSLPRVSILGNWQGRAAAEAGEGDE